MQRITSDDLVTKAIRLETIALDGSDLYWNEYRPEEEGRGVVMDQTGKRRTPKQANVRSRVHEYGGGTFAVSSSRIVYSNDGELFIDEKQLTHSGARFADLIFTDRAIFSVMQREGENSLVRIDLSGKIDTLHSGYDFYSSPALSPSGTTLAFLAWNHPHMPWDQTDLLTLDLRSSSAIVQASHASHFQPSWNGQGKLFYISDKSGYWNLYDEAHKPVCPMEADFGEAHWVFGQPRYAHTPQGIVSIYTEKGIDSLGHVQSGKLTRFDLPFTSYRCLKAAGNDLYFIAASPTLPETLYKYTIATGSLLPIRKSQELSFETLSLPEMIAYPSGEATAYGNYYPPIPLQKNPPLIVRCHGGPTTHAKQSLDLRIQFFTSRGFAVLDANYGGSTGYGRAYRERLRHRWGIVDVNDCCNGAEYLAQQGLADARRLIIKGSSAGGYTTLAALAFRSTFSCGISMYGISDLTALARMSHAHGKDHPHPSDHLSDLAHHQYLVDIGSSRCQKSDQTGCGPLSHERKKCGLAKETHKFEAHYGESLIAPYPQEKGTYRDRSPLFHADQITAPVLFLQGSDDLVVPPEQSEKMAQALEKRSIYTEYLLFQGEGHGFRKSDTIKRAAEAELAFIQKVFS